MSRSRAALTAYHPNYRVQIQANSRGVYQAQLESMALKEEQGIAKDTEVLGLFLLIILSIQSRGISQSSTMSFLRNGFRSLFDAGFNDEETGSALERILNQVLCVDWSSKTAPVTLSVIANSCNKEYALEEHTAYAAKIIQQSFLFVSHEQLEQFLHYLDSVLPAGAYRLYLVYKNDMPVAARLMIMQKDTATFHWMSTIPAMRRCGLCTALTSHMIHVAKDMGCSYVALLVSKMGLPIFKKLGFQEIEQYKIYGKY